MKARLTALALAFACAATFGVVAGSGAAAERSSWKDPVPQASAAGTLDRPVTDRRITENSGMVVSRRFPGVVWAIEDSGNPAVIDGIDKQGHTVARLTLAGAANVDWEALAPVRLPGGGAGLAVGDTGDNDAVRSQVEIYVVAEPKRLASAQVSVLATLHLTYPDGAGDAEALFADPWSGQFFIVSKDLLGAALYAVPSALWPPASTPKHLTRHGKLDLRAGLSAPLVTDGVALPDGRVVLRNYTSAFLFPPAPTMTATQVDPLARLTLPAQTQGEALALVGRGPVALIGGEGKREPILRISLGALLAAAPASTTTTSPTAPATSRPPSAALPGASGLAQGGATPTSTPTARKHKFRMAPLAALLTLAACGVASALLAFMLLTLRDRRRRRSRPSVPLPR